MKNLKAVIFDQDGLMFDTERISAKAWFKVAPSFGITVTEDFLAGCRGRSLIEVKQLFQDKFGEGLDMDSLIIEKRRLFKQELKEHGVPIKKGLKELLAFLKEQNYKIALATASDREYSRNNLESAGIQSYFDVCVCGDMVSHCKPDPELFLTAADKLGEKPESCLVLEDSLSGVQAALNGGFPIIMVPDLTQPDSDLEQKLTAKCDSLFDVKELLLLG